MSKYREVDGLFSGLDSHVVESRSLIEKPYLNDEEGVYIWAQILETLDDGMEMELCMWTDCDSHIALWDISIDKQLFDSKADTVFRTYLRGKGLYLENVKEGFDKWNYCGRIQP